MPEETGLDMVLKSNKSNPVGQPRVELLVQDIIIAT